MSIVPKGFCTNSHNLSGHSCTIYQLHPFCISARYFAAFFLFFRRRFHRFENCNTGLSKHSNISPTFYVHLCFPRNTSYLSQIFSHHPFVDFSDSRPGLSLIQCAYRFNRLSTHKHTNAYYDYNAICIKCKEQCNKFSENS